MDYQLDKDALAAALPGDNREWFMPTGTGGYVSGSLLQPSFRKQHGLLIASRNHPTDRVLLLAGIGVEIVVGEARTDLASIRPAKFSYHFYPTYEYEVEGIRIVMRIAPYHGHDVVAIEYAVTTSGMPIEIRFRPHFNFRDHCQTNQDDGSGFSTAIEEKVIIVRHHEYPENKLYLRYPESMIEDADHTLTDVFDYRLDQEYGNDHEERHYAPYVASIKIAANESKTFGFVASLDEPVNTPAAVIIENYRAHCADVINQADYHDPLAQTLVLAADSFIAHRASVNSTTVLAGLPWFTDWGRDTMIAFEGLFLATRRYPEGKAVLDTFAKYEKNGLIPNMFPETGGEPLYNTVDASLWFIHAATRYYQATDDQLFMERTLFPVMQRIIASYAEGTDHDIRMATDKLIMAGSGTDQLTWMDVRIDGVPVTPRHGKPVEIQALWYNALSLMAVLAKRFAPDNNLYHRLAKQVKKSFLRRFWNRKKSCLYDTVDPMDPSIRPNQLYAVALPFPLLSGKRAKAVMMVAAFELEDVYGIRSLALSDKRFIKEYAGNLKSRDAAYHMGTAWGYLFGCYLEGMLKNGGKQAHRLAGEILKRMATTLDEGCLGGYAEIFDGLQGTVSKGCATQAWSIAEFLRIYTTYGYDKEVSHAS